MNTILYALGLFLALHAVIWIVGYAWGVYQLWREEWARRLDRDLREAALDRKRQEMGGGY
jgi:hypothetical protein